MHRDFKAFRGGPALTRGINPDTVPNVTTRLELDDELVRRAEAEAKRRGISLNDLIERLLRERIAAASASPSSRVTLPTHDLGGAREGVNLDDSRALRELMDEDGLARC